MTNQPDTVLALLRDAERYLSALHGSVARHDNLAADLECAGCALRDRLAAALHTPAELSTDQAALRERTAEAVLRAVETAMDDTLLTAARERALAGIAAVLPAPADKAVVLTNTERQFLTFALDQAAEEMSLRDGFTDADQAAL